MTIQHRELNSRLTNLERCAELAPADKYETAKNVAEALGNASNAMRDALLGAGLRASNNDALRDVEAIIYGYLVKSNPQLDSTLRTAEGFGEHAT